jgi:hypothetical protein
MNSASTWPLRTVARAADVDTRCLRQWFAIGVLQLRGDDRKSTGPGDHVGLSRLRAIEAAIVQHLNRHGVQVSRAARAAFEFTLNGNEGRSAGDLYALGRTLLVIRKTDAVVVNADPATRVSDLSDNAVAIVVDVNAIVNHVDAQLNNGESK